MATSCRNGSEGGHLLLEYQCHSAADGLCHCQQHIHSQILPQVMLLPGKDHHPEIWIIPHSINVSATVGGGFVGTAATVVYCYRAMFQAIGHLVPTTQRVIRSQGRVRCICGK
jgi:hypothetical protein